MAIMRTSRLTSKTTIEPKMQTLKPTSVNPQKISRSEFSTKQAAYDKYVVQKAAYDADKSEYDARWNKWNELSGGQISGYNFEAAPKDPGKPNMSDVKPSRGVLKSKQQRLIVLNLLPQVLNKKQRQEHLHLHQ